METLSLDAALFIENISASPFAFLILEKVPPKPLSFLTLYCYALLRVSPYHACL